MKTVRVEKNKYFKSVTMYLPIKDMEYIDKHMLKDYTSRSEVLRKAVKDIIREDIRLREVIKKMDGEKESFIDKMNKRVIGIA